MPTLRVHWWSSLLRVCAGCLDGVNVDGRGVNVDGRGANVDGRGGNADGRGVPVLARAGEYETPKKPTRSASPAFSMGRRIDVTDPRAFQPGPGSYQVRDRH
eukprot:8928181-Pyramimonas_sp.AAC.2